MAKTRDGIETALLSSSSPAAKLAAVADLIVEFNGREKLPTAARTRAQAEAMIKDVLSGKTGSHYIGAWDASGKALGFALFSVCSGMVGDWAFLVDSHAPKGPKQAETVRALLDALVTWAKSAGLSRVGIHVENGAEDEQKLADEFGFSRETMTWRERMLDR